MFNNFIFGWLVRLLGYSDLKSKPALFLKSVVFVGLLISVFRFIKLERWTFYLLGGLFVLVGASWVYTLLAVVLSGNTIPINSRTSAPILIFLCGAIAWYLLRPSFWDRMEATKASMDEAARQKDAEKQLMK
jgi:hypothetical protein